MEIATNFEIGINEARERYTELMMRYIVRKDESALLAFNSLGLLMMQSGIPPEIAIEIHALSVRAHQLEHFSIEDGQVDLLIPMMEVIMAYGLSFREQLESQEADSKSEIYKVLEHARDMVFVTDREGRMTYSNQCFRDSTMISGRDVLPLSRLMQDEQSSQEPYWQALQAGRTFKGRMTYCADDACSQIWSVKAFPLFKSSNNLTNFVFMAEDISAQVELERRQRQTDRLSTLGELASGISHEFNNILLIISGFSELIKDENSPEQNSEFADEILLAVEKGTELNQQILSFAREGQTLSSPVRLASLIKRLWGLAATVLGRNIQLILDFPEDAIVTLSEQHLVQILTNLFLNARHSIEDRYEDGHGIVECNFSVSGKWLTLKVADNGNGMSENIKKSIFEPFFTTKRTGEGTGLGLSIILKIVDQHQGKIDVSSKVGQGSEFVIRLPVNYEQKSNQ